MKASTATGEVDLLVARDDNTQEQFKKLSSSLLNTPLCKASLVFANKKTTQAIHLKLLNCEKSNALLKLITFTFWQFIFEVAKAYATILRLTISFLLAKSSWH